MLSFLASKRRSRTQTKFGFVRFDSMGDTRRAIASLSESRCFDSVLHVRLTQFGSGRRRDSIGVSFKVEKCHRGNGISSIWAFKDLRQGDASSDEAPGLMLKFCGDC
ncbi:hypothetical protein L1049_007276 [Liquidambar formosana]|uniref:Uncharacterized protein n=1 Tax=Liquidambar formosana TaxID=63359 RepID=A0AAP0RGX8_LIQFO